MQYKQIINQLHVFEPCFFTNAGLQSVQISTVQLSDEIIHIFYL